MLHTFIQLRRRSLLGLGLCLTGLVAPGSLLAVEWHSDLATARAEARDRGLPLLIHFYSRNCGPCRTMEHEVFSAPAFEQATSQQFVLVKIDTMRQRAEAERLGVTSLPSDLVMAPDGRIVFRREGFASGGGSAYLASLARHRGQPTSPNEPQVAGTGALPARPERTVSDRTVSERSVGERSHLGRPPMAGSPASGATSQPGSRAADADPQGLAATQPRGDGNSNRLTPGTSRPASNRGSDSEVWLPPVRQGATPKTRPTTSSVSLAGHGLTDPQWGLEGYCPVTLKLSGRWQAGSEEFVARFEGRQYKLADRAALDTFQRDPATHAPQAGGADLVVFESSGRSVPGSTQFAAYFNGQLYLFASRESRTAFQRNPARYARGREGALRMQFERLAATSPTAAR
ncbi:MAG: thioredoxin family protein [Planctomycetaceae bacterium]